MIICETERLILRDFCKDDIDKRVEWWTKDCEWQNWDAPWEKEEVSDTDGSLKELIDEFNIFAERCAQKKDNDIRYSFQIEVKDTGEYIGWISCYCIDDDYSYTDEDGKYAFGIDIPPKSCRGSGYGYEAFDAAIKYLIKKGVTEIYTQTWSGNKPMIALAAKLGFEEIKRKKDFRIVDGQKYDGLTFKYMHI